MKNSLKQLNYDEILEILNRKDFESYYCKTNSIPDASDLCDDLRKYIDIKNIPKKSVLGIDIYKYGSYDDFEQTLIPFLFKLLFKKTIELCLESNQYIFQKYTYEKIINSFISIGDGGFLILDTPLHSLIFAINFDMVQRAYNSYHIFPKLRKIVGGISNRYAITIDKVYYFENNYYGRAIINNARILSKDNLNRCLLAQNAYDWFLLNIDGIENLQLFTLNEIHNIYDFKDYDSSLISNGKNVIISDIASRDSGIINSDILKIGEIKSKESSLSIYNLHIQATMEICSKEKDDRTKLITVSLGNLNTSGI